MEFAIDVWVAYAINKLFSLVLMIHGGRRKFTQECFEAKSNATPCCCLFCLPIVHNNVYVFYIPKNHQSKILNFNRFRHWAKFMKWSIIQFCFMNVIIGFISIVLYCDVKWREIPQTGVDGLTPGFIKMMFNIFIYIFFQTLISLSSGLCQPCCVFMQPICSKVFNRAKFWKGSLTRSIKSTGNFPPSFSLFSSQGSNAFFSQPFQRKII